MTTGLVQIAFGIFRTGSDTPVVNPAVATRVATALLGPLGGRPRKVEYDGDDVWLVQCTEAEMTRLENDGYWLVIGSVDGQGYEISAAWS